MTNQDLELWHKLQQAGVVNGEMPPTQIVNNPWYLRVLQGLTGWFAAWFLLGSVFAIFHELLRQESIAFVFGVLFIVGAYFVYRLKDSDFIGQFALAMSLTGQSLCVYAWHDLLEDYSSAWWLMFMMGASLAWLMPSFIHRFLSASLAVWSLVVLCISWPIVWLMPALVVGAVTFIWLTESKWLVYSERVRPIAYALTFAALNMHSMTLLSPHELASINHHYQVASGRFFIPLNEVLLATIFVLMVVALLQRYQVAFHSKQGIVALVAAVCVAAISQEAMGLAVAWSFILLGFANSNKVLLAIGTSTFWLYLARYYYILDMTLLNKSYLLIATGLFLLLLRKVGHVLMEKQDA
jgi:uncharacterized membrane protein